MERKGNSCPIEMCEKIYKKVTVSPAFQTIRRISHRLNPPRSASPASDSFQPSPPVKTIAIQYKPADSSQNPKSGDASLLHNTSRSRESAGIMVPINFEHSNQPSLELIQKNTQVVKHPHKNEPEATPGKMNSQPKQRSTQEEGGKSGVNIEDRVTEYINRAKSKIRRTISKHPADEGKKSSGSGKEKLKNNTNRAAAAGKDKFAEYIENTKKKLRTTSSIGVGKRNSFK